jgi:hypothetical protein
MLEFLQCLAIIALMFAPFAGLFVFFGKLGADVKRPQNDEHAGRKGNGAGIG